MLLRDYFNSFITSTETVNYPGTKLVGVAFKLRERIEERNSLLSLHRQKSVVHDAYVVVICIFKIKAVNFPNVIQPNAFQLFFVSHYPFDPFFSFFFPSK